MTAARDRHVPEGYVPHTRSSPAIAHWAPLWSMTTETSVRLGILVSDAHENSRGGLHGGVMATLCDNAMGLTLARRLDKSGAQVESLVTSSLSIDFVGTARIGDWVEIDPAVVHCGTGAGVVTALVRSGDRTLARANASFRFQTIESQQRERP